MANAVILKSCTYMTKNFTNSYWIVIQLTDERMNILRLAYPDTSASVETLGAKE